MRAPLRRLSTAIATIALIGGTAVALSSMSSAVGGSISGVVTRADGPGHAFEVVALPAEITTFYDDQLDAPTYQRDITDVSGTFTIDGLAAGDYNLVYVPLGFSHQSPDASTYLPECLGSSYDDSLAPAVHPCATGTKVTVSAGTTTIAPAKIVSARGGSITGILTAPKGSTLPKHSSLYVYRADTTDIYAVNTTAMISARAGRYTIYGVPPGSYKVGFPVVGNSDAPPSKRIFGPAFYKGRFIETADLVTVAATVTTKKIDVTVRRGVRVTASYEKTKVPGTVKITVGAMTYKDSLRGIPYKAVGGKVRILLDGASSTKTLKGKTATFTWKGLPSGRSTFVIQYLGTKTWAPRERDRDLRVYP